MKKIDTGYFPARYLPGIPKNDFYRRFRFP